jgi:hypothetical protein
MTGVAVVVLQWATHVGYALGHGMTYSDTMWYHQPFAARFVQHHSFDSLGGVGLEAARLYPLGSPLVHALGMLAFHRDVLSPFVNLAWLALTLLAAWCIGRRRRVPHLGALGAAAAVGLPILTATQPGQASSDIGAMALLLTAVALLLESELQPAPLAIAGLALGMAVGMKITVAVPAAVLALAVLVLAIRRGRRSAAAWVLSVAATGSFWFVRNWWRVGSPLPWFDLRLGPVHLPVHRGADAGLSGEPALLHTIAATAWRDIYAHGLWQSFGRAWPLVFLVTLAAIGAIVARAPSVITRVVGIAAAVGVLAYLVTPYTGELNFSSGLRFLSPLVLLAIVLASTVLPSTRRWRVSQLAALGVLVLVGATMPASERVPAWSLRLASETIAVVAVLGACAAASFAAARTRARFAALGTPWLITVVVVGGWFAQQTYLDHRYVHVGLVNDSLDEYFRDVHDARVGVFGTDDTFPMFGVDLSNDVRRGDDPSFEIGDDACRSWRRHLAGYDYVAVAGSPDAFGIYLTPPPSVFDDPSAHLVLDDGPNLVYRIDEPLDPASCPA